MLSILYEHDYNLILAVKWCQQIHHCTHPSIIHSGQYSGLPGEDPITSTVIEELQYKISQNSKQPLIHMDYNATA